MPISAPKKSDIMTGHISWWGMASAASSTRATAALHSVELVVVFADAHVAAGAEAERRRVARRAVGLGSASPARTSMSSVARRRTSEPLVGGLLLHLRALRRAEPHEVVGAVVMDVRQSSE